MVPKTASPSLLLEIADWVLRASPATLPVAVREAISAQVLSVFAATMAGMKSEVMRKVTRGILSFYPGGKEEPLKALEVLPSASMVHDYDDYLFMGHTGHSAVWVPLILGEHLDTRGEEILLAMVIANELGGRLGAAILLGPLNGQMWSPIHRFAAAGAAAKLLRLDREQIAHALALALYHPEFPSVTGFMGSDAKVRTAAEAIVAGVKAAYLARAGVKGEQGELSDPRGFLGNFAYAPLRGTFSGLGKSWVTLSLKIKPFPGCAYVDTPVLALRKISQEYRERTGVELLPQDLLRIRVYASALTVGMDLWSAPHLRSSQLHPVLVNFSTPLSLAVELLLGGITPEVLEPPSLSRYAEFLLEIAQRVEIIHDLSLTRKVLEGIQEVIPLRRFLKAISFQEFRRLAAGMAQRLRSHGPLPFKLERRANPQDLRFFTRIFVSELWRLFLSPLQGFPPVPLDLEGVDFSRLRLLFPARVEVTLKDGTLLSAYVETPPGGACTGTHLIVAREKWRNEGKKFFSLEEVERINDKVMSLDFDDPSLKGMGRRLLAEVSGS